MNTEILTANTERRYGESSYHWQIKHGDGAWEPASQQCYTLQDALEVGAVISPLVDEKTLLRLVRDRQVVEREVMVLTSAMINLQPRVAA